MPKNKCNGPSVEYPTPCWCLLSIWEMSVQILLLSPGSFRMETHLVAFLVDQVLMSCGFSQRNSKSNVFSQVIYI